MSAIPLTADTLARAMILLPTSAPQAEARAARELAQTLKQMTGVRIPVTRKPVQRGDRHLLLIGAATLPDDQRAALSTLKEDEVELRALDGRRLLFRGGGTRGSLYAVYEWLDQLGCRWYHPEETHIPERATLEFPHRCRVSPGFEYREALWQTTNNPDWACRNRFNGQHNFLPPSHGGGWGWDPYVHSFKQIVPSSKYAKSNSEYYSLRHGQGRITVGGQLCLSNPEVQQLAIDFALSQMADPSVRIVDISQNDCVNSCQCDGCSAWDQKAGSTSGSLIEFVNRIADATSRVYPDKFVGTLAYNQTQTPPRHLKAHPNVIVRLCHMSPSCDTHSLAACPLNQQYVRDLKRWKKVCDRMYVWHYVTNFSHFLIFHPNLDALAEDIRFYHDLGVRGIFFQAVDHCPALAFGEMHSYAQARLAWDPDRDYWAEASEFVHAYYGDAGSTIVDLLQCLHENVRQGSHADLYTHPAEGIFTPAQLHKAETCVKRAENSVEDDPTRKHRVSAVRLWLNYTCLTSIPPLEKTSDSFRVHAAPKAPGLFDACRAGMKKQRVRNFCEYPASHQDFHASFGWSLQSRDIPLEILENDHLEVQIAPELAGMICTLKDKTTGHDLFRKPSPWAYRYPYIGGYTQGRTADGFGPGFWNAFALDYDKSNADTIVLRAALGDGIHVERHISLDPHAPILRSSSAYTNRARTVKTVQPSVFVDLSLGRLSDIGFFYGRRDGQLTFVGNTFPDDGTVTQAQWVSLRGENRPVRKWGLYDRRLKLGLIEELGKARPQSCGSNAYRRENRVLLDTVMQPRRIAPGNRSIFRHQYRVIHAIPKNCRADAEALRTPQKENRMKG